MEELDKITQQLTEQQVNLEEVRLLFLDLSSTCTGYAIAECNFKNHTANFINAGAIFLSDKWEHAEKYHYIYQSLVNYFNIVGKVDYVVRESYSINTKRMSGCMVSIEIAGVVIVALKEVGISETSITPQSWRSALGIKPITTVIKGKKKRDYKTPTKKKVEEYVTLPEQIESNITHQMRDTPNDLTDAIALGLGALTKLNFKHFSFKNIKFQEPIEF